MVMAGVILATASWLVGMATYMRVIFMLSSVITFEVNASQLQKYEAEVRNHIKIEQQLKLHIECI